MCYEKSQTPDKWWSRNTDVGVQLYVSDGSLGWGLYWEKRLQTARGDHGWSIKVTHFETWFTINLHFLNVGALI